MAIPAAASRLLVAIGAEGRQQLLFEHRFNGFADAGVQAVVDVLAKLQDESEGCASVRHGVSSIAASTARSAGDTSAGGYAFSVSTRPGTDPSRIRLTNLAGCPTWFAVQYLLGGPTQGM